MPVRLEGRRGSPARPSRRARRGLAAAVRPAPLPRTAPRPATIRRRVVHAAVLELDGDGVAEKPPLERLRRPLDRDLAPADDRDPLREVIGLLEVVGREEDGQLLLARKPLELLPHRRPRLRVEARGRLVEEQHLRPVDEPERHVEPALHPARVRADDAVGELADPEGLEQLVDPAAKLGERHAAARAPGASGSRAPVALTSTPEFCGT